MIFIVKRRMIVCPVTFTSCCELLRVATSGCKNSKHWKMIPNEDSLPADVSILQDLMIYNHITFDLLIDTHTHTHTHTHTQVFMSMIGWLHFMTILFVLNCYDSYLPLLLCILLLLKIHILLIAGYLMLL